MKLAWIVAGVLAAQAALLPAQNHTETVGQAAHLLYPDGHDEAIVANYDEGHVVLAGVMERVRAYERGLREPLMETLTRRGVRTIAMNFSADDAGADTLTHGQYLWFAEAADHAWRLTSAAPLLSRVRAVKTATEIARLRAAVRETEDIFQSLRGRIRPGMSERQIHALFVGETRRRGHWSGVGESLEGPLTLLPKAGMAHRGPTDAVLEPGDMLVLDFSVQMAGYSSDVARTFYCLRPGETVAPDGALSMFRASRAATEAASRVLQPGVRGHEVDQVARDTLRALGYPEPTHALGHTVGQRAHDGGVLLGPRWERYGSGPDGVVEAGMVFAPEPTILPGGPYAVALASVAPAPTQGDQRARPKR